MKLVIKFEELKARVETKCQREPAKRAVRGFDTGSKQLGFMPS
jgi:hypothetical protein